MKFKSQCLSGIGVIAFLLCGQMAFSQDEKKQDVQNVKEEIKLKEVSLPNLLVPTNLDPLQPEFIVQHRFEGAISDQPLKNFFGAEEGATVRLGLRFLIWSKLEVNVSHIFSEHEYEAGLSYAVFLPKLFLKLQLDAQYLNYVYERTKYDLWLYQITEKKIINDYYLQFSMETYPILDRIKPVINVGYDGYNRKRVGCGVGLSVKVVDWLYLQGEFFPNFFKNDWRGNNAGSFHSYAFGVMFQTWGHNFILMVQNGIDIGTRRLMMGSDQKALHLGFNITKVF